MDETVTLKGKSFKLNGKILQKGDKAPDCLLTNQKLEDVKLSSFFGKTLLIMTLPSLDTSVCSKEAHRFNQELGRYGKNLISLAVSMDLPFAQQRWCAAEDVDRLITLSDFRHREFGERYGLLIPGLGLLARSVMILDPDGTARYVSLIKETTEEPNYDEIFEELTMQVG